MNAFDLMEQGITEAQAVVRQADRVASRLARLLKGRLRKVDDTWTLAELKRELRDFNIHTRTWKEDK